MARASPLQALARDACGELLLALAVVDQLRVDTRSQRPDIRAKAQRFLADGAALTFWGDLLGIDPGRLAAYLQASRAPRSA